MLNEATVKEGVLSFVVKLNVVLMMRSTSHRKSHECKYLETQLVFTAYFAFEMQNQHK